MGCSRLSIRQHVQREAEAVGNREVTTWATCSHEERNISMLGKKAKKGWFLPCTLLKKPDLWPHSYTFILLGANRKWCSCKLLAGNSDGAFYSRESWIQWARINLHLIPFTLLPFLSVTNLSFPGSWHSPRRKRSVIQWRGGRQQAVVTLYLASGGLMEQAHKNTTVDICWLQLTNNMF